MCGSNGTVQLYSRDGIALGAVAAHPAGMAALVRPATPSRCNIIKQLAVVSQQLYGAFQAASADGAAFAVACEDGSIRMHGLRSDPVHSTYGQRSAYRWAQ